MKNTLLDVFDPTCAIEDAWMPGSAWYCDPATLALEAKRTFSHSWQYVARVDQLQKPGDYVAGHFLDEPYVVVRDDDGQLQAFANVCRHHAAELTTGTGCIRQFQCPYHGWLYALDGRLLKAPRLGPARGFKREAFNLVSFPVAQWGPLVFVQLRTLGAMELPLDEPAACFPELDQRLAATDWEQLHFVHRRHYDMNCNWKVYVDNYLDGGYHVDVLHGALAERLDLKSYVTTLHRQSVIQSCGGSADTAGRLGTGAIYGWLYPNLMLNRYGDFLDTNWVIPLGAHRTRVVFDYFHVDPDVAQSEAFEASLKESHLVQEEDTMICESVQRGLQSATYERGRYAPRLEQGEYLFHQLLYRDYADASSTGP